MSKERTKRRLEELTKQTDDWENNQNYLQLKKLPLATLLLLLQERTGKKDSPLFGGNPQQESKDYNKHKDDSLDSAKKFLGMNKRPRKRDQLLGNTPQAK